MKYYAGYDSIVTDVAVFNSKEERDRWVDDSDSAFIRIAIEENEVPYIVGDNFELRPDYLRDDIIWIINSYNIIMENLI